MQIKMPAEVNEPKCFWKKRKKKFHSMCFF